MQHRPFRGALVTLILTTGLAVCDTACASTKRKSGLASQSIGLPASQRHNPSSVRTSKPRDAAAGVGGNVSERIETADTVATTKETASVSTAGEAATTLGSTSSQSPTMTVATTTTQPRSDTEVEPTSHNLWPFLIGFAIAAAAGLILLFRRSLLRAR
jgi:hypothetical protein